MYNIVQKLIKEHLIAGEMKAGEPITIRVDQTLTQDSTGTMAYLQLEALDIDKVVTKRSVAYIDHNMLQSGFENADDHAYIQSVALKHGVYVSKPGNGICHQVHLERFGVPGQTLVGSDSHTPTGGGIGMFAMGAGGMDVALAMARGRISLVMPKVVNVVLKGKLSPNVSAKDLILKVLEIMTVKGGVGKAIEYTGEGVRTLTVPERATVTNMGAELGATTSVFESDEVTLAFLKAQGRESDWTELKADKDATYDEVITIDLSELKPLCACPHMPDAVKTVAELEGTKVDQVCVGSCTDSSLLTMLKVAKILKGKKIAPTVSFTVSPGSRQVLTMLSECGALADILDSGARVLECACGPCIGMGQSPKTNAVSLRTFNRNFYARSGTESASVYLVSPETAAYSAINGYFTDPSKCPAVGEIKLPTRYKINDNLILNPSDFTDIKVERGPNIKPFPIAKPVEKTVKGDVLVKTEDNITTDHIMPSNAKLLPFRSNIPYLSEFCLSTVDKDFASRAKAAGGGIIVAGANYGQGSSREHAALAPLQLGIKAVIAKSFARMHRDNLINCAILPLTFENESDYDTVKLGDKLTIDNATAAIESGKFTVVDKTSGKTFTAIGVFTDREKKVLLAGGTLNAVKKGVI